MLLGSFGLIFSKRFVSDGVVISYYQTLCKNGVVKTCVVRCAIWYHLKKKKKVKNTHGRVLLLVKLQAEACILTKSNSPPWVFSCFLNCRNGAKSRHASHVVYLFLELIFP